MTDSNISDEVFDSQATYYESEDESVNCVKKHSETIIAETESFRLIDSYQTNDGSIENNEQFLDNPNNEDFNENNLESPKHEKILSDNLSTPILKKNNTKTESHESEAGENLKKMDGQHKNNDEDKPLVNTSEDSNIINGKSNKTFNKESLKRKFSESNEKHSTISKSKYKKKNCGKTIENNTILEVEKDNENTNLNVKDDNTNIDTVQTILTMKQSEKVTSLKNETDNNAKLLFQCKTPIHSEKIKNVDSNIKDDIIIIDKNVDEKKADEIINCYSTRINEAANLIEDINESETKNNYQLNDSVPKKHKDHDKSNLKIETTSDVKTMETLNCTVSNKEEKPIKKPLNTRMSIEEIYCKETVRHRQEESSKGVQSQEEIILDVSQEEINLKSIDKEYVTNAKSSYESCTEKIYDKNITNLVNSEAKDLSKTNIIQSPQNKNNVLQSDCNNKLTEYSNQPSDLQMTGKELNLPKSDNSIVVTISDSDNSIIEDCGKGNYLNTNKSNHENVKLSQKEQVINFNIKLKCLLSIDENTKEICQKQILSASCDPGINSLAHQKVSDSSTSTACLADISSSDNKDSSPASINSASQLHQLQPSRLSFVSSISSSSSTSCALSIAPKKINHDTKFSYPRWPAKHMIKHTSHLSSEDKQGWDIFEKLIKEWKNSHIIISTITNFLNNEALIFDNDDCDNKNSDLLVGDQILRSSTPELEIDKNEGEKLSKNNEKLSNQSTNTKVLSTSKKVRTKNKSKQMQSTVSSALPEKEPKKTGLSKNQISTPTMNHQFLNKQVFAKWSDNNYYPGEVSDVIKMKYKVNFYDGKTKLLLPDFILLIEDTLDNGSSVYVYINEDKYASPGMIIDVEKEDDVIIYIIETDGGEKIRAKISDIFLTSDQAQVLKERTINTSAAASIPQQFNLITLSNVLSSTRRSKRTAALSTDQCNDSMHTISKNSDLCKPSVSGVQSKCKQKVAYNSEKMTAHNKKEQKKILGVQDEIIGTLDEQIVKGPLNKVKGKARYRKKLEIPEDVEILGPIPEPNSNIFKGMTFILSCVSPETLLSYRMVSESSNSNSEPGTENEEEWIKRPFIRDRLQAQLIAGGGKIYNNFEDIPPEEYVITKHITNVPNLTKKSLLCLSVGIRSYNHQWVIRSCQQNKVIQPAEEELPSGWSLDKQAYIDTYQRPKNRPLEHTIVGISLFQFGEEFVEFWKTICENAGACVQILENPAKSFMEATIVLATENCPQWIISQANKWNIPILSTTWVVQCLIEGKLCSHDTMKEYQRSISDSSF